MIQGLIEKMDGVKRRVPAVAELLMPKANSLIKGIGERIITRRKVRELLFEGYHVPVFERASRFAADFGLDFPSPLPNNTFGVFFNKNGTSPGPYSINTGIRDVMDLGQIATFKSRP